MQRQVPILNFRNRVKPYLNKNVLLHIFNFKNLVYEKIILLAFVFTISTAVFAQTTTTKKDLKQDVRDLKQDKKELRQDIKNDNKTAAKQVRADMKADKKDIRHDAKELGIKHPRRHPRRHHHY